MASSRGACRDGVTDSVRLAITDPHSVDDAYCHRITIANGVGHSVRVRLADTYADTNGMCVSDGDLDSNTYSDAGSNTHSYLDTHSYPDTYAIS